MKGRKPTVPEVTRRRGETQELPVTVIGGRHRPPRPPALDPDMLDAWNFIVKDLEAADVLDHADAGVIEAACVFWGRARQARSAMQGEDILTKTPQGPVPNRLLQIEKDSWREFRALAESLPLSPYGRARLGLKTRGPRSTIDADIGRPPRLSVVNGTEEDV